MRDLRFKMRPSRTAGPQPLPRSDRNRDIFSSWLEVPINRTTRNSLPPHPNDVTCMVLDILRKRQGARWYHEPNS